MRTKPLVRAACATAGAVALGLTVAAAASAHVTISTDVNTSGSYAKVTVRVPSESEKASTTKIRLEFPENTFGSVRVQPHPGWTAKISKEQLETPVDVGDLTLDEVVTAVTWTAEPGAAIGPDQFDEFDISLGPLPDPGTYEFPAIQSYDDGEVVAWDLSPDSDDVDRPAPAFTIVEGDDDHSDGDEDEPTPEAAEVAADSSDGVARGVAAGGVAIGLAGVGVGAAAWRKARAS